MQAARARRVSAESGMASWRVAGLSAPLVVEVRFADDVPVFNPAYLGRLTPCVQRIVP